MSFLRPRPGSEDFFAGLVRDYGYMAEDSANAIYECLRILCTVRGGRRKVSADDPAGLTTGPEDYVDEELLQRVVNMTVAGASDGCKVALNSVQEVQKRYLKNLRYQFRDRPHTTRTCQKGVLKYMNEGRQLMSALISGEKSFAKRCKHSRRFQQIWLRKQAEAIAAARRRSGSSGSQPADPDLFAALANLAHAEHRFDSRSEPMSIMCSRFGVIIEVLLEMADDQAPSHRADRAWALGVLNLISGKEGINKLLIFGIECDFAVATQILVRVQDGISPDIALTAPQVSQTLEIVAALFREGQVFLPEAAGMYTSQLLRGLRRLSAASRTRMRWPADFDLSGPRAHCKTLHAMVKEFFRLNYPDYDWRRKFGAFNNGTGAFPTELRLQQIGELAIKEGMNPDAARSQFLSALPHMKRLYEECGDNREAWCAYLELLRCQGRQQEKEAAGGSQPGTSQDPDKCALLNIILTYVSLLDCTSDVERMFSKLAAQESKHSERHMTPLLLSAVLTVAAEVNSNVDSLVTRNVEVVKSQMWWRPGPLLLKAMRKYAEFYGMRKYASRSVLPVLGQARAMQRCRARVGTPRVAKHVTKKAMKQRWCATAKNLVTAWKLRTPASALSKDSVDKKKLSKKSRKLHKRVMAAQAHTQNVEKRKFKKMEAQTGLAKPVAPLQGMPRQRKDGAPLRKKPATSTDKMASKVAGKVAKASGSQPGLAAKKSSATATRKSDIATALRQAVSPKLVQQVRQRVAATTAKAPTVPSAPVKLSFFRMAKGMVTF